MNEKTKNMAKNWLIRKTIIPWFFDKMNVKYGDNNENSLRYIGITNKKLIHRNRMDKASEL